MNNSHNKKKIIIFPLIIFVILCLFLIGFSLFKYFYHSKSEAKASQFIWDEKKEIIYYLSPKENGSELRMFRTAFLSSPQDEKITTNENTLPSRLYSSSGNQALLLEKFPNSSNIWLSLLNLETQQLSPINLKNSGYVYSLSPNQEQIAYASATSQVNYFNLNLYSIAESQLQKENILNKNIPGLDQIWWTKEGKELLISALPNDFSYTKSLYSLNIENKELKQLFTPQDGYLKFYPHEDQIIFVSNEGLGVYHLSSQKKELLSGFTINPYNNYCAWLNSQNVICQILDENNRERSFWKINTVSLEKVKIITLSVKEIKSVDLYFLCSEKTNRIAYFNEDGIIVIANLKIIPWF